jgi:hypothetical protein
VPQCMLQLLAGARLNTPRASCAVAIPIPGGARFALPAATRLLLAGAAWRRISHGPGRPVLLLVYEHVACQALRSSEALLLRIDQWVCKW